MKDEAAVTNLGIGLRKRLVNDLLNAGLARCSASKKRRKTYGRQN